MSEVTDPPVTQSAPAPEPAPAPADDAPKLYTQADLDRIAAKVRSEEKTKQEKDAERVRQQAAEQHLKENGEFKTLHEQSEARARELESELAAERLATTRAKVAARHNLPEEIAELLKGDTPQALEAHAAKLEKLMAPPKAADTEGGSRQAGAGKASADATFKSVAASGRYASL